MGNEETTKRSAWLGFAEWRRTQRGTHRLRLRWGRIAATLSVLALAGYLCLAGGVYMLYKERRGFSELAFTDVLFLRRTEIRQKQGEFDVSRGIEALQAGSYREALAYLRTGVTRAPDQQEGRLVLISIYAGSQPELAARLFEQGMHYGQDDADYMRAYAQFLSARRQDQQLLETVEATIARVGPETPLAQEMALFAMQAATRLGRFSMAADYYRQNQLWTRPEGLLEAVNTLQRAGHAGEAIVFLDKALKESPGPAQLQLYARLIELQLAEEQVATAVRTALDLSLRAPLAWQPRVLLLRANHAAGRSTEVKRESGELLRQFRTDPEAVAALAQFAQSIGDIDLARQTYEAALENNFEVARYGLLYIETHLQAGRFAEAIRLCLEIEAEKPRWLEHYTPEFNSMRSIAYFASGNIPLGNLYLNEFLGQNRRLRARVLHVVAESFREADLPGPAYEVLTAAHTLDAEDERILASLIEVQIELGESRFLPERVAGLLELRRPDYTIFEKVSSELASDRFIFAEKRESLAEQLQLILRELPAEAPDLSLPTRA